MTAQKVLVTFCAVKLDFVQLDWKVTCVRFKGEKSGPKAACWLAPKALPIAVISDAKGVGPGGQGFAEAEFALGIDAVHRDLVRRCTGVRHK